MAARTPMLVASAFERTPVGEGLQPANVRRTSLTLST